MALKDWKSTTTGLLSSAIALLTPINGLLAGNDLSSGAGIHWSTLSPITKIALGVNAALAICRGIMGIISKDPDQVPALVPGQGIQNVPAHPVPDDPNAIAVVPKKGI